MKYLTNFNLVKIYRDCVVVLLAVLFSLLVFRCVRFIDKIENRLDSVSNEATLLIHSSASEVKRHSEGFAASKEKIDSLITNADELVKSWKRRRLFPLESGDLESDSQD